MHAVIILKQTIQGW